MTGVSVKVMLFASFRRKYGVKEVALECDGTIRGLIESASKALGESFIDDVYDRQNDKVRDDLIFAVNGRNIKDLKGDVRLNDQDVVAIFPPLAGGSGK